MDSVFILVNVWHVSLHLAAAVACMALMLRINRSGAPAMRLSLLNVALCAPLALPVIGALVLPEGASIIRPAGEAMRVEASPVATAMSAGLFGAIRFADVMVALLIAGALARAIWVIAALRRLRRGASAVAPEGIDAEIAAWQRELGTRAVVAWRTDLAMASTSGLFPPRVWLPIALATADPVTRRAVVCHELIHVRRADWAPVIVEEALRTIFWFHPLVHWAVAEIRLAREELVDRDVVARTGARRAYLELLLSFGAAPAAASGPLSFFIRRQLERRIRGLTQEVTMTRTRLTLTALMALTITGAASSAARYVFPLIEARSMANGDLSAGPRSAAAATPEKTLPKVVHQVAAVYPEDAKEARVEGVVEVAVTVDTDGAVAATRVVKSVAMLDDAAEAALKQWRFEPGREDGKPVRVEVRISVRFSLK